MDENIASILIDIKGNLGELSGQLKVAMEKLTEHEVRLTQLERGGGQSFKEDILQLTLKTLMIAVITIASLTGGGALIKQIFNI